jgi:pyruvate-formate lyase-activating enzyme
VTQAEVCFSDREGRPQRAPGLQALARSGHELVEPGTDWIPLPPGTTLSQLPDRLAQGRLAGRATTLPAAAGWAAAAILPPGYTRTLLPAYQEAAGARVLPLYGYSAVAWFGNELRVAGVRTDPYDPWQPRHFNRPDLAERVEALRARFPNNRVIEQLATCALEYRCFTAQNTFYQRWEGALPSSHGCNAACLGCISEQWGEVAAPQARVAFRPSAGDLSELALYHLSGKRATMVSFGQGCEGEPLTRGATLVEALRAMRAAAPEAQVHVNTNGSRPGALRRLLDAGLASARVSAFSFSDDLFTAYYRPVGYGLEQVRECLRLLQDYRRGASINLLTLPGVTDDPGEIDRLAEVLNAYRVGQVQLRTLNVDPLWLLRQLPRPTRGIGFGAMLERLRRGAPHTRLGNFSRPQPVGASLAG